MDKSPPPLPHKQLGHLKSGKVDYTISLNTTYRYSDKGVETG